MLPMPISTIKSFNHTPERGGRQGRQGRVGREFIYAHRSNIYWRGGQRSVNKYSNNKLYLLLLLINL